MEKNEKITIEAKVKAPIEKVWKYWTDPKHIVKWNSASEDWHTTKTENNLQVGGKFTFRMEAKDGSMGFDFGGTYDQVKPREKISYTLHDDRKVQVTFVEEDRQTKVVEVFETETTNPVEMQRNGWQAILDNFKVYTESN
ncbi:SRPBCC family protein [Pareuzebyella sediminis]|uniref:SRPBCC family protein n=1 Tax=Pareuzebyella sediminis TaxID=2607998 RepID=UPI0011EF52ED|nr:SRPBCC family protein [Pareuzebyella sediminis]